MHFRFEINLITNEILGPEPGIRILDIAWYDKQQHIHRYLEDYYREHRELPSGMHDLGTTEENHLGIGMIDFDAVREHVSLELSRKERRNLRSIHAFNFGDSYRVLRDNLIASFAAFFENHLRLRYYWRGQWFTRAWWYYHHK